MGDRLADHIVVGEERTVGAKSRQLCEPDAAGGGKQVDVEIFRQVVEGLMMVDRADEGVTREQRAGVQEGDHCVGAQDDLCR